jgi:hypothetical protein
MGNINEMKRRIVSMKAYGVKRVEASQCKICNCDLFKNAFKINKKTTKSRERKKNKVSMTTK